ncbi:MULTISPECIES: hypothetical protein [Thermus]|jgi:hypothetical protein|uniref:Uncharacterized protein n=1 Tax=Thermus brockianus TaxID=56956 RepID=A0A1J0LXZ5_THEBO|nr:hypothetical protein [Thermus brockianus]APD10475.1 hypothetical protein A0O31_02450 [Thermus brockianus]BDG17751.1 hypothetical protein TbrSNM41_24850 [Thermus brockianus]
MSEKRTLTPEEWAEMLAWLRPRLSVGVRDNPMLLSLKPREAAEIVLKRLNAQHLTEFQEEWVIRELVNLSRTPLSFMLNLEALVRYRLGLRD